MESQHSIKWWSNGKSAQYQMVVIWKVNKISNGGPMESQDNIKWWSNGKPTQYQMVVQWKVKTVSNGGQMESQDSIKWWSNGKLVRGERGLKLSRKLYFGHMLKSCVLLETEVRLLDLLCRSRFQDCLDCRDGGRRECAFAPLRYLSDSLQAAADNSGPGCWHCVSDR